MDAYASDFPQHQPLPFNHGPPPPFPQPMPGAAQSYNPNFPPSTPMMHPAQQQMHYLHQRGTVQNQAFLPQQQPHPPFSSPQQVPLTSQAFIPSSSQAPQYPPSTQQQFQHFPPPTAPQFPPHSQPPPQSPAHIHQQPPRPQQPSPQSIPLQSQPPLNAPSSRNTTPISTATAQSGSVPGLVEGGKMHPSQHTPTQSSTPQQHTPTAQKPGGPTTPQSPNGPLPVDRKLMEQRIEALLEINGELLREMIDLQSQGKGGGMPPPATHDAEKKDDDKFASPEFVELMKRFQANLAWVIFWHERATNKGKPGQQAPPGPMIMTPPAGYDAIAELYAKMVPLFNGWKGPTPKPPVPQQQGTSSPQTAMSAQQMQAQRARMAAQMHAQQAAQMAQHQAAQQQAQQQAQLQAQQQAQQKQMQQQLQAQQQQQQQPPPPQ
ncbi:hypothetical protein P152DRAFT_460210 [Eremomyces bilateralis CBS 781.70]|uniref:Uncharacterized protein n=1 Tax=Eremomyces bilateralis CBS 781.70 TaxID=1392243 RepID=A0A6G1FZ19_9PEZI|nr:uncharacterized protein P152DRAFT_460210 [Eremomyces bilateralis CBS 781.70]KAF1810916.1 hypothetical protein P152DRAFT_460210 [Eremomyces bilateralis CBS 781.70]